MPPWYIWVLFGLHLAQMVLHGRSLQKVKQLTDAAEELAD